MIPDWLKILFCLALGFFTSLVLIPFILQLAEHRGGANRGRDFHHSRTSPVVRLGGVALAVAFAVVALAIPYFNSLSAATTNTLSVIVFGSLAMFALGFWDDLRPLGARVKFIVQIVIAGSVYFGGIKIEVLNNPFTDTDFSLGLFGFFITILWLVTLTNLINLMDGIDGLAGGICLMLMCLLANLGMGALRGSPCFYPLALPGRCSVFLNLTIPRPRSTWATAAPIFSASSLAPCRF